MQRFSDLGAVRRQCERDCEQYLVYDGWVLDVRGFSHPGPQGLVTANIGKDVTAVFDERGHSAYARELCERMAVGYVGEAASRPGQLLGPARETMSAEEEAIHRKLDATIDITQPIVPQVERLSNKEYLAFVRRPRHLTDTDCIKLHADEATDLARKSDFGVNLRMCGPCVVAEVLAAAASQLQGRDRGPGDMGWATLHFLAQFLLCFCGLGIGLMWTLTEYYFHAIVLHDELRLDPDAPADGKKNGILFARHLHHHVFMNQKHRVVLHVTTYYKYVPAGFALVMGLAALGALPVHCGLLVHAGWLGGSLLYDGMHFSFHHGPDIKFSWYQKMKAAHMRHHFRDNSVEFGVTNPWWDLLFGTARNKTHVSKKVA